MPDYPNRSDLRAPAPPQPVRVASGQQYGQRQAQVEAQQAIPLPDFNAPTRRPGEPVTAGVPTGPGPSAAQAGIPQAPVQAASVSDQLRAIYSVYPTEDLMDLILSLDPTQGQ